MRKKTAEERQLDAHTTAHAQHTKKYKQKIYSKTYAPGTNPNLISEGDHAVNTQDYTYTVLRNEQESKGRRGTIYTVSKWGDADFPQDQYDVFIPFSNSEQPHCSCPGFFRQKYIPRSEHKHLLLVKQFVREGEPQGRVYSLSGGTPSVANNSLFMAEDPHKFDPSD